MFILSCWAPQSPNISVVKRKLDLYATATVAACSYTTIHTFLVSDDTLYSHYSSISTVEGNWGLDNLGRGDVNKTLSNLFKCVL